ncbi:MULTISPECIES: hypothetical protein [Methylococcus]|uniref:hypothetical protein n=1 Tax=Methylococcus TaxID=413 RepID=UPI0018DFE8BC|nr:MULTISPECIES: hypothetical protein [Methylococcus]
MRFPARASLSTHPISTVHPWQIGGRAALSSTGKVSLHIIVTTALTLVFSACAGPFFVAGSLGPDGVEAVKISGIGQNVCVSHPGRFDLEVSGEGQTVRVPKGNAVRMLRISGVRHEIAVSGGTSVQSVWLSGIGSTVHLPKNVRPTVSISGVNGRVLNDVDTAHSQGAAPRTSGEFTCESR